MERRTNGRTETIRLTGAFATMRTRLKKWTCLCSYLMITTCFDSVGLNPVSVTMCIVCVCVCVCVCVRERERDRQTDRQRERVITSYHIKPHETTWGFTLHYTSQSYKVTLKIQVFSHDAPCWLIQTFRRHSDPRNVGNYLPIDTKFTSQKKLIFSNTTGRMSNVAKLGWFLFSLTNIMASPTHSSALPCYEFGST